MMSLFRLAVVALLAVGCQADWRKFKIGMMLPFSDPSYRDTSDALRNAAYQASMDMNQLIKLVSFDSRCDASEATTSVHAMADMGVKVIFGAFCSTASIAAADAAEERGILMVSPTSSSPLLTNISKLFFRTASSDSKQSMILAEQIMNKSIQNLVIAYTNDTYGVGIATALMETLEDSVENITMMEVPVPFNPAAAVPPEMMPEGVVLLGNGVDALADMLIFLTYDGFNGSTFGADTVATPYFISRTGSSSEGMIVTSPHYGTETFAEGYEETWGNEAITYSAQGYDAMKAIILAWRASDRAYNYGQRTDGASMARKMLKISFEGAQGEMAFGKDGDPLEAHYNVWEVVDGTFRGIEDSVVSN